MDTAEWLAVACLNGVALVVIREWNDQVSTPYWPCSEVNYSVISGDTLICWVLLPRSHSSSVVRTAFSNGSELPVNDCPHAVTIEQVFLDIEQCTAEPFGEDHIRDWALIESTRSIHIAVRNRR